MEYLKFSEFAKEERHLEGPKKRIDEVLNLEILITGYKIGKSKYKNKDKQEYTNYLTLQIEIRGEKFIVFTGSQVLIEQVKKYEANLPFLAKIVKIDQYYSLS